MRENIIKLIFGCLLLAGPTFLPSPCNAQAFEDVVKSSYISVRKEAKFNSVIVAKKIRGDRYRMLFEDKNWVRVEFEDGVTGWLFKTVTMKNEPDKKSIETKDSSENKNSPTEVEKTKPAPNADARVKSKESQQKSKPTASAKEATVDTKPISDNKPLSVSKPIQPPVKPSLVAETSLNAEELYNEAIILYEKRKYEEALEKNLFASKKAPKNAEILNNIGNCLFKLGKTNEALEYWLTALKVSPKSGKICNNIGIAYYQINKSKNAIEYYKKAILFEPDFPDSYYNLASAYGFIGDFKNAILNYKLFLEQNPEEVMTKLATERIEYCEKQIESN
ncbi:MAG: tetratricopeptide repeat protein [Candidatus Riflebacteria bacterium]|nr:tetratricopeptide repeat protein [Candidatus Riflebacteria bacterium]